MILDTLALLTLFVLSAASPVHQNSPLERGSPLNAAKVANDVPHSRRDVAGDAFNLKSSATAPPSNVSAIFNVPPPESVLSNPLGNAAFWQEALDFDAQFNTGNANQMVYRQLAFLQLNENTSVSFTSFAQPDPLQMSSLISRALQYANIYPAQLTRPQAAYPAETLIRISSSPQQTITGFGASGAWWPNYLKDFPPEQQKNLTRLLFSEEGLQLSSYRYNIGASGDNDITKVNVPGRGVESFMKTDGTYDWTRDSAGIYFLKAAVDAGVSTITFFINAIPSGLTANKNPCGSDLTLDSIPLFADYIVSVLSHWSAAGIPISYISPMNEPDSSFYWCTQEGMTVRPSLRPSLLAALRSALTNTNTNTTTTLQHIKILADETSQIASQALVEYPTWLPAALEPRSLDAIAIHSYDFPDDTTLLNYRALLANMSSPPLPLKMTETSTFRSALGLHQPWGWTGPTIFGREYDPGIASALDMARQIWQYLTLANAESWEWWTAVSIMMPCSPASLVYSYPNCATQYNNISEAYNDGLVYVDPRYATTKDYSFYLPKRFHVLRHFSRFIRPGAVRYDVPNEMLPYGVVAVAAENSDGVFAVIFVNRNATEQSVRMEVPRPGMNVVGAVVTTQFVDWGDVEVGAVGGDGGVGVVLPPRGVVSVRFAAGGGGGGPATRKTRREHSMHEETERKGRKRPWHWLSRP
ncbi:MAG: hypothetical protein Q9202_001916 [Teloschistes flavicans]